LDYSKLTLDGQFNRFYQNDSYLPLIDFENKSLEQRFKEMISAEQYKHYY